MKIFDNPTKKRRKKLKVSFDLATGSVIGRDHISMWKNNQDSYIYQKDEESGLLVALVADGCGECEHSETGAAIGSRITVSAILSSARTVLQKDKKDHGEFIFQSQEFWKRVQDDVLAQLRVIALQMGESLTKTVSEHFLFTLVGVLITPKTSIFFAFGDGVIYVNGDQIQLGKYLNNAPPYIGYGLVSTTQVFPEAYMQFRIPKVIPTEELDNFLVGTDGVEDIQLNERSKIPGKEEEVGPIAFLWENEKFFHNKALLTRRLRLLNTQCSYPVWSEQRIEVHSGLLHDDTTMIVGRRQ